MVGCAWVDRHLTVQSVLLKPYVPHLLPLLPNLTSLNLSCKLLSTDFPSTLDHLPGTVERLHLGMAEPLGKEVVEGLRKVERGRGEEVRKLTVTGRWMVDGLQESLCEVTFDQTVRSSLLVSMS